jgi:hypothetical protein
VLARSLTLLVTLSAAAAPWTAVGADVAETMGARYMRYEGCMVKRFGRDFYERLGIATAINRWGAAEPTLSSLALQPENVREADRSCRKESGLEKEARPKG